jgi:hypothetical protein
MKQWGISILISIGVMCILQFVFYICDTFLSPILTVVIIPLIVKTVNNNPSTVGMIITFVLLVYMIHILLFGGKKK